MLVNRWTNTGALFYDFAINGVPYFSAASQDFPYVRRAAPVRRDQIDVSAEAGEQTLAGWWLRSQGSFDLGCGAKFLDGFGNSDPIRRRASNSYGVNLFEEGQVTLLKEAVALSAYTATNAWMINYGSGVAFAAGLNIYYRTDAGTSALTWGGNGTTDVPADATTDGSKIYIASFRDATSVGGVYATDAASSNRRMYSGTNLKFIEFLKERLIASNGPSIYVMPIVATNDTAYPTALFTHPNSNFSFESFAEGPNAVYAAGYAAGGNYSAIYALTVADENGTPTLQVPTIVAELPRGEYVRTITSYLGTYLLIGTNLGLRVAIISGDGSLVVGALMLEQSDTGSSDGLIRGIAVSGRYAYAAGWSAPHGVTPETPGNLYAVGIYKIDLSRPTNDDLLVFAWQRDISYQSSVSNAFVSSVAMFGNTGRAAYLTQDHSPGTTVNLCVESPTTYRSRGWVDTPTIRFDTLDNKWFATVSLFRTGTGIARIFDKDNLTTPLGTTDHTTTVFTFSGTHNNTARISVAYRIQLEGSGLVGPTVSGYQVKAAPRNVQQIELNVPLLAMAREKAVGQPVIQRNVWDRLSALETLQQSGEAVLFQDLRTGEEKMVFVSDVRFISTSIPEQYREGGHGGVISATLTTVGIAVPA